MKQSPLVALYKKHPLISEIKNIFKEKGNSLYFNGLSGSVISLIASALSENSPHLIIMQDKDEAAYLYHDIIQLVGSDTVFFLSSTYKRSPEFGQPDTSQAILRTETLRNLRFAQQSHFYISYPEALTERVPDEKTIENQTLKISKGEQIEMSFVADFLKTLGFNRSDFVYEPGQFSVRGSIIDVFGFSHEDPYRIDFFGDEIESIRSFDIENQLSKCSFEEIYIVSDFSNANAVDTIPITEFIPANVKIWLNTPSIIFGRMNQVFERLNITNQSNEEIKRPSSAMFIDGNFFKKAIENRNIIVFGSAQGIKTDKVIDFHVSPQPMFHKQFDLLEKNIKDQIVDGYEIYILSDNKRQLERLKQIFADKGSKLDYKELEHALHEGFIDKDLKLCIYTDHQIFDRYHKFLLQSDRLRAARQAITLKEISRLNPGDYVVHVDHGIGRFGGLVTVETNGKMQEAIRLVYRDNDVLLVNIHSLHRISKFKGAEGTQPKINKLGSGAWQRLKENTKKKVKDIARELIALYARRKSEPGFAFSSDSFMQKELEASFMYEDTPDQVKATIAVKSDMEAVNPMDRLVCGDVGFGKTEIAVRAAFKAVADSKQAAILVPTTILALQHYRTFSERLKDFPCRVEYISRLRKQSDVKIILEDLKYGKVDILIGTHRLVGKDVVFKDLGLTYSTLHGKSFNLSEKV